MQGIRVSCLSFRYLLSDIDRVLPCVACTEDENRTRADFTRDQAADQLFPCEAEQQRQLQGPVQRIHQ